MAASQTKIPAGYRLVKTCSLFFWPSTGTREKRRQFVSMGRRPSSPPLPFALKKAPEAGLGALFGQTRCPAGHW